MKPAVLASKIIGLLVGSVGFGLMGNWWLGLGVLLMIGGYSMFCVTDLDVRMEVDKGGNWVE